MSIDTSNIAVRAIEGFIYTRRRSHFDATLEQPEGEGKGRVSLV
jgi:hypothetical protein